MDFMFEGNPSLQTVDDRDSQMIGGNDDTLYTVTN